MTYIESKLQEIGAEAVAACGNESIAAAVYVEASRVEDASFFHRSHS
jgi:hypothetical protein